MTRSRSWMPPAGTRRACSATRRAASWLSAPLVLHGAQDPPLRPAAARRIAAAIRGARLVILPGVGHYLPAAVYPQVAGEVRALAGRAATAAPKSG
jgi:pimeloyl-ACP methyl ester carboxylesterase